jgi:hypothetical protein
MGHRATPGVCRPARVRLGTAPFTLARVKWALTRAADHL